MIQRPQSICLAFIGIAMLTFIFLPVWEKSNFNTGELAILTSTSLKYTKGQEVLSQSNIFFLAVASFISSCLAFGSLFSYRNRLRQMKINLTNHLLIIAVVGLCLYYIMAEGEKLFDPTIRGSFKLAFALPAISLFCNSIANRLIRRDDRKLKASNRIR